MSDEIIEPFSVRFFAFAEKGMKEVELSVFEELQEQGFSVLYDRYSVFEKDKTTICLTISNSNSPIEDE